MRHKNKSSGMSLVEMMMTLGVMSIVSLGVSSTLQSFARGNKNIEQKQAAIQLGHEVTQFLSSRDTCTMNFGSTSAAPVRLSDLPDDVDTLIRAANPNPTVAFKEYDGTANTLYENGMIRINRMQLRNFVPILDSSNAYTNSGELEFVMQTAKNSSSDAGSDFREKVIRMSVTLGAVYNPGNMGANVLSGCVAVGGSADSIWVRKSNNDIYYLGGNVGIGSTDPNSALDIVSSNAVVNIASTGVNQISGIKINEGVVEKGGLVWRNNTGQSAFEVINYSPGPLNFMTSSAQRMTITNTGNVGIGLPNPAEPLSVYVGANNASIARFANPGGWGQIVVDTGNVTAVLASVDNSGAIVGTNTNHPFHLRSNNLQRVTVAADGKVGIGTTAPIVPLEVVGSIKISGNAPACDATSSGTVKFEANALSVCYRRPSDGVYLWGVVGGAGAGGNDCAGGALHSQIFSSCYGDGRTVHAPNTLCIWGTNGDQFSGGCGEYRPAAFQCWNGTVTQVTGFFFTCVFGGAGT